MSDCELLELAAKAAGIENLALYGHMHRRDWNPLTDDGDNARLRRSLRIVVQWFPTDVAAMHWSSDGRGRSWAEPYGDDRASAERRAVVRAAAEIGRTM